MPATCLQIAKQFFKANGGSGSGSQTAPSTPSTVAHAAAAPEAVPSPSAGREVSLDVDSSVARHLAHSFGDRAQMVLALAAQKGLGARLHPRHPILEAEVAYCAQVSRKWYLRCSCSCFAQNGCAARLFCMTAYAGDVVAVPTELQVFKVQQGAVRVHRALT